MCEIYIMYIFHKGKQLRENILKSHIAEQLGTNLVVILLRYKSSESNYNLL